MKRNAKIEIDLLALNHNFSIIQRQAPQSKIMAMVKANAYGHGAIAIAQALPQAEAFGVASLQEAIALRHAGITQAITLFSAQLAADELPLLETYALEWVIHHASQIQQIKQAKLNTKALKIWMKLDTGMHRLGFPPDMAEGAHQDLLQLGFKAINLMTHFAAADTLPSPRTAEQIRLFQKITQHWKGERSLANSAGIFAWPNSHADWIRPGIALYGVSPFADKTGAELGLKAVMRLSAPLLAIHSLKKGDYIGYGEHYCCPEDQIIGVFGLGYADGYPRQSKMGTPLILNGTPIPRIGKPSMDLITADLTHCPNYQIGDFATAFGPEYPVETLAKQSEGFSYEILCHSRN